MTAVNAALLGVVQGLTEFLPISSSAHLILARALFGWNADQFGLSFDVACHVGTLVAVVAFFRVELLAMAKAVPAALRTNGTVSAHLVRLIAVGSVPVVVVGLLFEDAIERTLRTPAAAIGALTLGAFALLVAERFGSRTRGEESLTTGETFAIGVAQAAALIPGVSRSGATITMAILLGLRREAAARFSFLLGVPAVLAAAAAETLRLRGDSLARETTDLFVIGVVSSAVVGYFVVKYFLRYVSRHSLDVFAVYRLMLASAAAVWLMR